MDDSNNNKDSKQNLEFVERYRAQSRHPRNKIEIKETDGN